jgi:hypothetical protein
MEEVVAAVDKVGMVAVMEQVELADRVVLLVRFVCVNSPF